MKEGWRSFELKDLCSTAKNIRWNTTEGEVYNYIDLTAVNRDSLSITETTLINKDNAPSRAKQIVQEGDVIFATTRPTLRRVALIDETYDKSICSTGFCVLRPSKQVLSKWIFYQLQAESFYQYIEPLQTGASYPAVTDSMVRKFSIPMPPLPEQQQIVDFLDAEFAKIDELKNQAEQSLQNAKGLFQAALKEMLTPKEGWKEYTIDEVVDEGSPISYGIVQPGDGVDKGVPVVRPVDLTCKQLTDTSSFKKTTEEIAYSYKRTLLKGKEILMCVRGTTGVISLTSDTLVGCNVTRGIVPFQIEDDLLRNFLYYTIKAPIAADYIQIKTQGAALKQINIADVKKIPIWLPSAEEQKSIVSKLEIIDKSCKQLQSNYTRTIQLCADLKQALLRQVFE